MERLTPAENIQAALSSEQREVMAKVLAEEETRREHVVVYLSGAHAYGFPSPDSDLDLKAIHVAKTADILGFDVPLPTVDRAEIIRGVEISSGGTAIFLNVSWGEWSRHRRSCSTS